MLQRGIMATETASVSSTVSVTNSQAGYSVELRKNFNALAVFAASLPTDARGHAQVKIKLPDNLTRYRVEAISVAGGKFAGERNLSSRPANNSWCALRHRVSQFW